MTHSLASRLCLDLYNNTGHFDLFYGRQTDDVYIGVCLPEGEAHIVFRGSTTILDFLRDFRFCMVDSPLGPVEQGFYDGIPKVFSTLKPLLEGRLIFLIGHSLGAARSLLFAGEMIRNYYAVSGIFVFGSPRPGGGHLTELLQSAKVPISAFENQNDPVVGVPLSLPTLPYQHPYSPSQTIKIDQKPKWDDPWGPIAPHHMELYAEGVDGYSKPLTESES